MKKLIAAVALSLLAVGGVQAQDVKYDPVKAQIGYRTAGCMRDWIKGALNRGSRNREDLVVSAVYMCGAMALDLGWTKNELVVMAFDQLDSIPGVSWK